MPHEPYQPYQPYQPHEHELPQLNHHQPTDVSECAELPFDLVSTHDALVDVADAWNATLPPAERLIAFTRRLPEQQRAAAGTALHEDARTDERARARRDAGMRDPSPSSRGGGRVLAGLVAAVVIVGLLAATLLKLAPGRATQLGRLTPTAPTTAQPTPPTLAGEEPAHEPPAGQWTTVAHAQLIPAPSDGSVVYSVTSDSVGASTNSGATWRALTLPTFSPSVVLSTQFSGLRVSASDARVVLLSLTLFVTSASPSACPAGSRPPNTDYSNSLHGGVLASGQPYCIANYASHDGGASWTPMSLPADVTYPPAAYDAYGVGQLGNTLYGVNSPALGFSVSASALLVSHDLGASWVYTSSSDLRSAGSLCDLLPSASDNALYIVTSVNQCVGATAGERLIWRSDDGGATWRHVSTLDAASVELIAAARAAGGPGVWLYALTGNDPSTTPATYLVSVDGGVHWRQAPQLTQAQGVVSVIPVTGALADGSVVAATFDLTPAQMTAPSATAQFYAWRPGAAAWRQLAPSLTANFSNSGAGNMIALTRGGAQAIDSLWVTEMITTGASQPAFVAHRYAIR